MKESLYVIPDGCICMGDGLFGVPCTATEHAYLKQPTREQILESCVEPKHCTTFHPYTTTYLCKACGEPAQNHPEFMAQIEEKKRKKL